VRFAEKIKFLQAVVVISQKLAEKFSAKNI
jgi:hypothetical protein